MDTLSHDMQNLTTSQKMWIKALVSQLNLPHTFTRNPITDWITEEVLERIGDALRIHHALSRQPLTKDRFEFAFENSLSMSGIPAELVKSRTNRGHDITIAKVPVCLKTEAAANINEAHIHISKWMELGKGEWDLGLQRDKFLDHLKSYDRIFTLRCLKQGLSGKLFHYELVEIPKALLLESAHVVLETQQNSRQSPKPGYGYVYDKNQKLRFALYFDGGTERKLQIKHLDKSLCVVHATWEFDSKSLEIT